MLIEALLTNFLPFIGKALLQSIPPICSSSVKTGCLPSISLQNTLLVVVEALGVNCLYAVGRRKFVDIDKMRRYNAEMKAFRSELSAATKAGDKAKVDKLKRKQLQMNKMQAEMSMDNMKPTLLFMVPLLGVYYIVSSFIKGAILVISPIDTLFHVGPFALGWLIQVPFFWWYMICSFTFSGIITRLFGLSMD
jgi:uncharacterized membrane protein (DUF106 family)